MFLLICFQKKEKSLTAHFACRAIDCKEGLKKMPAVNASEKARKKPSLERGLRPGSAWCE